jgi:effector-binding domain-containing protein
MRIEVNDEWSEPTMAYQIELKTQARRDIAVVKFSASEAEIAQRIGAAFGAVQAYLARAGFPMQGPAVARYTLGPERFDVASGFIVSSPIQGDGNVVPDELPECDAAVTNHIGAYSELPAAYSAIQTWMRANGREPAEFMWEEYWSGPSTPPEQTRTDVVWPVKSS